MLIESEQKPLTVIGDVDTLREGQSAQPGAPLSQVPQSIIRQIVALCGIQGQQVGQILQGRKPDICDVPAPASQS